MTRPNFVNADYNLKISHFIMFQSKVRSYGICPSPPGLFHLAWGSGEGIVGRGVFRNYCGGHMDKTKGEGGGKGEVGLAGVR